MLSTTTGTPVTRPGGTLYVRPIVNHAEERMTLLGDESEALQSLLYAWFFTYSTPQERHLSFSDREIDTILDHCDGLRVQHVS